MNSATEVAMVVATTGRMTAGVVQGMAERVSAVRAELSSVERRMDAAGKVMAKSLRRDLLVLESRLADAQESAS